MGALFRLVKEKKGYFLELLEEKEPLSVYEERIIGKIREWQRNSLIYISFIEDVSKLLPLENSILEDLSFCKLIDEGGNEIRIHRERKCLEIVLKKIGKKIYVDFLVDGRSNFQFINPDFVISQKDIYPIYPIGNYKELFLIRSIRAKKRDLELFISYLFSNFKNFNLIYKDYKIKEMAEIRAIPAIYLEEVDELKNLIMRLDYVLKGVNERFPSLFSFFTRIDDEKREICIYPIRKDDLSKYIESILRLLKRIKEVNRIKEGFVQDGTTFIIEEGLARKFIEECLSDISRTFDIFGSRNLLSYGFRLLNPKIRLNVSYGIDFLEGDASLIIEDEEYPLEKFLNEYKKYGYIPLKTNEKGILNSSLIKRLERIFMRSKKGIKISFFDLPIIEDLLEERQKDISFKKVKEVFLGFNQIQNIDISLPLPLRPYQLYGVKWLKYLYDNRLGGCLADDMGLGKTIQIIGLIKLIYEKIKDPILIVVPKSLIFNWEEEIKKFSPEIDYFIYYGKERNIEEAVKHKIIITSYATVRQDIEKLRNYRFDTIILDESQQIKNPESQISKAVCLIDSGHRFALSGTPIENNLLELYSLFRFLNPSMFPSLKEFRERYLFPIQREEDLEALKELRKKIYPFILRRTKKDVLEELPDKIEQVIYVELNKDQASFYEERRRFFYKLIKEHISSEGIKKSQFFIFQALTELRQIATVPEVKSNGRIRSSKRRILIDRVKEAIENDHKVLIFTNFLGAVDSISEDLEDEGIEFLVMTGSTRERGRLVKEFQENPRYKAFILTLKTGGLGLNLIAADMVFIYDPWWNISAETQAIDRTHRIGQKNTIFSFKLIAKGTIEEKILLLQKKKEHLFKELISSDLSTLKYLDEEDIEIIFG